jgi:hypothetical protein
LGNTKIALPDTNPSRNPAEILKSMDCAIVVKTHINIDVAFISSRVDPDLDVPGPGE